MRGPLIEAFDRRQLHDFAGIQHGDAVRNVTRRRQVVRYEKRSEPFSLLQLLDQVQNLGLDRDIERADRFVENDETRVGDQRAGDRHTLALAARELMGIAPGETRLQPHPFEHVGDSPPGRIGPLADHPQRLGDGDAAAQAGVERPLGVLQNHREPAWQGATLARKGLVLEVHGAPRRPHRAQANPPDRSLA